LSSSCHLALFTMVRCKVQRILWSCAAKQFHKQTNKINERKKSKMLTWVPLRLPRGSYSLAPSLLLQPPAPTSPPSSPAPSSLPLDVSGAFAMEWGGGEGLVGGR
jgi:hypothetical protein